jgi:nitrate reductase gamma subunit
VLLIGGSLFYYGAPTAIGGHALGLLISESWTKAIGIDEALVAAREARIELPTP